MQPWNLRDDLDRRGFWESWLTDPDNSELTEGALSALFWRIQEGTDLGVMFLKEDPSGRVTLD